MMRAGGGEERKGRKKRNERNERNEGKREEKRRGCYWMWYDRIVIHINA
jgi:hypothetical protein